MAGIFHKMNDGWFTFYVNVETGERKLRLENGDKEVPHRQDDFCRVTTTQTFAPSDTEQKTRFK